MEIAEILSRFDRNTGRFEKEAVLAAIARREEITPALLSILEKLSALADDSILDAEWLPFSYAMFLLAQFRETRAHPLLVRCARLPEDMQDFLFGDNIAVDLGNALASTCGGKLDGIQSIVEDENANEWARYAALESLVVLAGAGLVSRAAIVDYFGSLFRGKLAREQKNEIAWSALVNCASDLYPEELLAEIERAFADGLVDEMSINMDNVRRELALGKEAVLAKTASDPHHHLIDDTVKEMEWWHCFHEEDKELAKAGTEALGQRGGSWDDVPVPIRRIGSKIGRNDPCPCGSGKKHKRCCGQ
jgi:hypothetical protein